MGVQSVLLELKSLKLARITVCAELKPPNAFKHEQTAQVGSPAGQAFRSLMLQLCINQLQMQPMITKNTLVLM